MDVEQTNFVIHLIITIQYYIIDIHVPYVKQSW